MLMEVQKAKRVNEGNTRGETCSRCSRSYPGEPSRAMTREKNERERSISGRGCSVRKDPDVRESVKEIIIS